MTRKILYVMTSRNAGKSAWIEDYIIEKLRSQEPEETADFEIINSEPNAESVQKLLPGGDQSHQ